MPQGRPTGYSDESTKLARRLFARAAGSTTHDAALVIAAERICLESAEGLSRWFGPYGSLALVTRALDAVKPKHPALSEVTVAASATSLSPSFTGLAAGARAHGARATSEGVIAMIAALADLIGRLVGDDIAATLLEQSVTARVTASSNGTGPAGSAAHSSVKDQ